eukprot:1086440-Amphidinium_carterae.1
MRRTQHPHTTHCRTHRCAVNVWLLPPRGVAVEGSCAQRLSAHNISIWATAVGCRGPHMLSNDRGLAWH